MLYDISLPLPSGWISEEDRYEEVDGADISHLECSRPAPDGKSNDILIDIYAGDMPADTTAEDEAYANYAEIIGWDEDEDDEDTIAEWKFQRKTAYGFSGECEDGSIMLLMCVEIIKGALLIISIVAPDDEAVGNWAKYIEENIKVRSVKAQ